MEEAGPYVCTWQLSLRPASFRRRCTVVLKVRNAAARLICSHRWHLKLPSCWCSKAKLCLKVQREEVDWFHSIHSISLLPASLLLFLNTAPHHSTCRADGIPPTLSSSTPSTSHHAQQCSNLADIASPGYQRYWGGPDLTLAFCSLISRFRSEERWRCVYVWITF